MDLNHFQFDYDLTWFAFFMNHQGKVLGRYGGRDAGDAEGRISLPGLRYALNKALKSHADKPNEKPQGPQRGPDFIENYPPAKQFKKRECIHCHQVYEIKREHQKELKKWDPKSRWRYPLPENVGIVLHPIQEDTIKSVSKGSLAEQAGLTAGDKLLRLNGISVGSFADVTFGLHIAPEKGTIPVEWLRGNERRKGSLKLPTGWRKTNITWRPSLLEILPNLPLFGEDLPEAEKKKLGLAEKHLAFKQDPTVSKTAREAGIKPGDIIIGLNDQKMEMDLFELLGHVRQNYLVGDQLKINVIRNGKRLKIPLELK